MPRHHDKSHPSHPLYAPGQVQPSSLTSVPYDIITGAPQRAQVVLPCDHVPDEPMLIPGPPGPAGPAGSPGAPGGGSAGATLFLSPFDEPAADPLVMIPGPQGPQGIQGIPGAGGGGSQQIVMLPSFEDQFNDDSLTFLGVAAQAAAAAGAGVTGSGTPGVIPKWSAASVLTDSVITEVAGNLTVAGGLVVQAHRISLGGDTTSLNFIRGAADNYQIRSNDNWAGAQEDVTKPSWAFTIGEGVGDQFGLYRRPPGGAFVALWKATNAGHWQPAIDVAYDLGSASLRVRQVYAAEFTNAAPATNSMLVSTGTIVQFGLGSSWQQLNFYTGGTARWHIPSTGHWLAVLDNTYDIGQVATLRPRTVYAATSVVTPVVTAATSVTAPTVNASTTLQVAGVARMNSTKPVWTAPTTTVNRAAVTNTTTLANLAQAVGTLIADLRSIGILA